MPWPCTGLAAANQCGQHRLVRNRLRSRWRCLPDCEKRPHLLHLQNLQGSDQDTSYRHGSTNLAGKKGHASLG